MVLRKAELTIVELEKKEGSSDASDKKNAENKKDEKIEVETKKVQRQVVEEILEELLKSENIALSQDELASIILKKVA